MFDTLIAFLLSKFSINAHIEYRKAKCFWEPFFCGFVVRSKAVVHLMLVHCFCCSHCLWGSVFSSCFVIQYFVS